MFTFLDYYRMKPALLPEGVEVIRGQTPAGGAYAVVLYLDSAGRKTAKEKAKMCIRDSCCSGPFRPLHFPAASRAYPLQI